MRLFVRTGLVFAASAFAALTTGGCSTVVLSEKSGRDRPTAEHAALVEAASLVAATPWPKPEAGSWTDRLVGDDGASGLSEGDAAKLYVEALAAPRKMAVLDDAARHLAAGRALADAAEAASGAMPRAMADVSIIEGAIADFRQTRDVYLTSLKLIERAGEPVASVETRRLKTDFSAVIEDLGAAADRIADEAENDATRSFAGPAARLVN